MRFKYSDGLISRWLQELGQYDFSIVHRSGKKHSKADGLSRNTLEGYCEYYVVGKDLSTLPCGGCEFCTRMHSQWKRYVDNVDDVVPLAFGRVIPEKSDIGIQVPREVETQCLKQGTGFWWKAKQHGTVIQTREGAEWRWGTIGRRNPAGPGSGPVGEQGSSERLSSMELSSRPEREQGGGKEPMEKESRQDLGLGPLGEQGSSGRLSSRELSPRPGREQGVSEEPMEEDIHGSEEERAIEVLIQQIGRADDFEREMDQEVEEAGEYLRGAESNFMAQVSLNDWRERLGKDTDLWPVIHWLQESVVPTPAELKLQSPSTKHFWLCHDHLRLENGVLFYEWHNGFQKSKLLVIPKSMREAVIKLFHDAEVGGH